MAHPERKRAVITGTSRGIGAEIAVALAGVGVDIVGNHVDSRKEAKQGDTAARVLAQGVTFDSILADISEAAGRQELARGAWVSRRGEGIDYLVLNAAEGLERDKPEDYAETINIKAQHGMIDQFLPIMNPRGKIIFITSLWCHRYGDVKQLPAYGAVASTKHQFEQEFRGRIPELRNLGIDIGVVVGHVVRVTAAHTLFSRMAKEELARLEPMAKGGKFPDAADMGNAVKDMLLSNFESGHTVYVGGDRAELIEKYDRPLTREEVYKKLAMYSPSKMLVDGFELIKIGEGKGFYIPKPRDFKGHFTGRFNDIKLWRGVDQLEALAQGMGLTLLMTEGDTGALGVFRGVRESVEYLGMAFPGDRLDMHNSVLRRTPDGAIGNAEFYVGDNIITRVKGLDIGIIPNLKMARRIVENQRSQRQAAKESTN